MRRRYRKSEEERGKSGEGELAAEVGSLFLPHTLPQPLFLFVYLFELYWPPPTFMGNEIRRLKHDRILLTTPGKGIMTK